MFFILLLFSTIEISWGGFNLDCGNLENGNLEANLVSKKLATDISRKSDGNLEINLELDNLEK